LILEQLNADDAHRLNAELARVSTVVSDIAADRRQISAAAQNAGDVADQVAKHTAAIRFDATSAMQLMRKVSGSADWIAHQSERSAEQAAMVLNSLVIAYCKNAKPPIQRKPS
jgi:hypothetical protein